MPNRRMACVLVGDHLGQLKRVLPETGETSLVTGCPEPTSSNPVVSIEPIGTKQRHLIANKGGDLYIYDFMNDKVRACTKVNENVLKALPIGNTKKEGVILLYEKQIVLENDGEFIKHKKGEIRGAKIHNDTIGIVGKDIPLRIFDLQKRSKLFEADPPEKNWLGIRPDINVAALDFIAMTRVATCSRSDSVIRVYDTKSKPKPVINIDINQTAFNEHAEAARFTSISSSGDDGHTIVVGSNIGQMLAIDLRFNVKINPKKRLQPKNFKVLGGFKGARGATIKDLKFVPGEDQNFHVVSCCLDRYLRFHLAKRNTNYRELERNVYMTTKPYCCSIIYDQ